MHLPKERIYNHDKRDHGTYNRYELIDINHNTPSSHFETGIKVLSFREMSVSIVST